MKQIYLAGPITGIGDDARNWRIDAGVMLKELGFSAIDPLVVEAKTVDPQTIVQLDYAWIAKSHGVLVRVDRPSWGTAMELVYAHNRHIPVVAWGEVHVPSPWLIHHVTAFKPTMEEGIQHLKELLA